MTIFIKILRYFGVSLIVAGITLLSWNIAGKRVKPLEREIQEIRQTLESHNKRINQLEQPELVDDKPIILK